MKCFVDQKTCFEKCFCQSFLSYPNESIHSECAVKGSCEKCLITVFFPAFVNTFFTIDVTFIFNFCHCCHHHCCRFESALFHNPKNGFCALFFSPSRNLNASCLLQDYFHKRRLNYWSENIFVKLK